MQNHQLLGKPINQNQSINQSIKSLTHSSVKSLTHSTKSISQTLDTMENSWWARPLWVTRSNSKLGLQKILRTWVDFVVDEVCPVAYAPMPRFRSRLPSQPPHLIISRIFLTRLTRQKLSWFSRQWLSLLTSWLSSRKRSCSIDVSFIHSIRAWLEKDCWQKSGESNTGHSEINTDRMEVEGSLPHCRPRA